MRKFKLDKEISKRLAAFSMAGMILVTGLVGCSKNKKNEEQTTNSITETYIIEIDVYSISKHER